MRHRLAGWRDQLPTLLWNGLLGGVAIFVAARLGVFSLSELVSTASGNEWLPTALASVDHPFHIARAETLRRAVLDGELLRWIPHHQGGYPVEFYPLAVAWLEVVGWGLALGSLSIPQVHTIVVAAIFLAPGLAYLTMAKVDGWSPRVAVLALTLHVVVPGDWWHGGYTELVQWGLVTNVAGAVAALFCLAWLTRYVASGTGGAVVVAAVSAAAAVYANPRSLIALAVAGVGVWLTCVLRPGQVRPDVLLVSRRIGLVGLLGALLAAPELLSLLRFSNLYQFVRYEWYSDAAEYLQSAVTAVSLPVFALAVTAFALVFVTVTHVAARAAAITLILYGLVTIVLIGDPGGVVSQLEPTRLMPFQRLLTVYLAASAIEVAMRGLARYIPRYTGHFANTALAVLVVALLVARSGPVGGAAPVPGQTDPMAPALYPVERAAVPAQADLRDAIELADAEAEPGTALLVIGSALSWHQRLWAPLWSDRPLYYDNWLWFWHDAHAGPPGYVWDQGHHYPDPSLALDPAYLSRHGIGAIVVTGPAARVAALMPMLSQVRDGTYSVFVVREPTTTVTFAGANADQITVSREGISASGSSDSGTATVRHNWYPRWRASVNGEAAPISRTDDGYMQLEIPPGAVTLEMSYVSDALDWLGRGLTAMGMVAAAVIVGRPLALRHRVETTSSALAGSGSGRS